MSSVGVGPKMLHVSSGRLCTTSKWDEWEVIIYGCSETTCLARNSQLLHGCCCALCTCAQPCRSSAFELGICAVHQAADHCIALQLVADNVQQSHGSQRAPAPGVSNEEASLCSRVHSPMSLTFALQARFTVFFTWSMKT